ncbi:hypothetical protein [Vibrio barjaei]|uniref:hypothetical protein n=1 Tax=Vibrio barjaei TaxID=1676683 RepID=UPI00228529B0|nr:hypothetical protein [Vibrio barjaei]MCY9872981.1 hypothetical protein [Vibrio barjaei]
MKFVIVILGLLLSGFASASCDNGGKSCVDSIYSGEKKNRFERTQSGSVLSSELPNSGSIEKNVDLSHLVERSKHDADVGNLVSSDASLSWRIDQLTTQINQLNLKFDNINSRVAAVESSPSGGGGFSSVQTICWNCEFTADSDGIVHITGSGGRSYINIWTKGGGKWGRDGWVSRCFNSGYDDNSGAVATCTAPINAGERVMVGASHGYGSGASGKFYKL